MPHVPLESYDTTLVAGIDLNTDMEDTLPGSLPHVYADIVAVGLNSVSSKLRSLAISPMQALISSGVRSIKLVT